MRKSAGSVAIKYIYNVQNRLIRVEDELSGLVIAEYGYDPFGRRLWKEVDGTRTYFFYSDEGLIAEYDDNGNEIRSYGYQPDSLWTTDPLWLKQNGQYYWYQNDHLEDSRKAHRLVSWASEIAKSTFQSRFCLSRKTISCYQGLFRKCFRESSWGCASKKVPYCPSLHTGIFS